MLSLERIDSDPSAELSYKQSPRCYDKFKLHLLQRGFSLFPGEFDCVITKHPFVDIAAKMGSHYWAFEYKSEVDNVAKSIEQLQCYSLFFDYVVLVSERIFDHKTAAYWQLKSLGAGIWFFPGKEKCIEKTFPNFQTPKLPFRRFVRRRFRSFFRALEAGGLYDGLRQSCMTEYIK
jgi:hypothetical protein